MISLTTQPSSHTDLLMSALIPNFVKDLNTTFCLFPIFVPKLISAAFSLCFYTYFYNTTLSM